MSDVNDITPQERARPPEGYATWLDAAVDDGITGFMGFERARAELAALRDERDRQAGEIGPLQRENNTLRNVFDQQAARIATLEAYLDDVENRRSPRRAEGIKPGPPDHPTNPGGSTCFICTLEGDTDTSRDRRAS